GKQRHVQPQAIAELTGRALDVVRVVWEVSRRRGTTRLPGRIRQAASDVLEILAGLEANGAAGRDTDFFPGPGIPADAALARLHLEDAETAELDSLATLHREPHRVEDSIDCNLGLDLGDVGDPRHLVDDVYLDHGLATPQEL